MKNKLITDTSVALGWPRLFFPLLGSEGALQRTLGRSSSCSRSLGLLLGSLLVLCGLPAKSASTIIVDQANDSLEPAGGLVIPTDSPVGQQFVPSRSALDIVELMINDQSPGNNVGAELFIAIKSDGVNGALIGVSDILSTLAFSFAAAADVGAVFDVVV